MKIIVLAGGLSTERDVSITTGMMVSRALKKNGHSVVLLDVFLGYESDCPETIWEDSGQGEVEITLVAEEAPDLESVKAMRSDQSDCFFGPNVITLCQNADMVYMALHGENGENGKIQAAFDLLSIRYTGTGYLGSALAMDKGLSKQVFETYDILTPAGKVLRKEKPDTQFQPEFPCVVKPCCGGSSIGVSIVEREEAYEKAVEEAFSYEDEILVEQYVKGREVSVGIVDGEALPIIEIIPKSGFYDYKNKYQAGMTEEICPAVLKEGLAEEITENAVIVYEALKLEVYARIDFLIAEDGKVYCLEANTLPGMTATSLLPQEASVAGIGYEELCEKMIQESLKKYDEQQLNE